MNLLAPIGLAALIALPIVVLMHMRHTTPVRRPTPSLRFWEAANPRPAEARRLRRPPLTWPLILQFVAALVLAIALARPATASQLAAMAPGLHAEPRHLFLLLDGSTSMSALTDDGTETRWDAARREALARLAPLREGDVATVILMGTRTTTFTATDDASLIALRERLTAIPQPGGRADLDAALSLASDLRLPNLERVAVVISDGAAVADPITAAGVDAPVELAVAGGAAEERANLAVTRIEARPNPEGGGAAGLYASVVNYGLLPVTASVALLGDGLEMGRTAIALDAGGGSESLRWLLPPGVSELTVRIEQADALAADNTATILPGEAATTTIAPRILLISDLPGALARALMAIENVQLSIEPSDNTGAIAAGDYDLAVFDRTAPPADVLTRMTTASLWAGPPVGGPFATGEGVSDPRITRLRAGDPLLEGVDLSGVTFGPTTNFTLAAGDEEIVGSPDGPLLFRSEVNGRPAVVLTADPEASNLPKRVAFPVLVANLVGALAPDGIPAALPLGEPLVYEPRAATASVEIAPPSGEAVTLAVAAPRAATEEEPARAHVSREVVFSDTGSPGAYRVTEHDAAGRVLGATRFVVNAGHERESDLRLNPDLADVLANASGVEIGASRQERVDLWPLLALLALGVILAEGALTLWPPRRGGTRRVERGAAA